MRKLRQRGLVTCPQSQSCDSKPGNPAPEFMVLNITLYNQIFLVLKKKVRHADFHMESFNFYTLTSN